MGNLMLIAVDEQMNVSNFGKSNGFCAQSADIWQVVGYVLLVFKIVIPIILIVLGMIDLGRAVVSSKDDEIKKSMKSLMMRAIAAIAIFFVPSIISLIMGVVGGFKDVKEDYDVCRTCIANPTSDKNACHDAVNKLKDAK